MPLVRSLRSLTPGTLARRDGSSGTDSRRSSAEGDREAYAWVYKNYCKKVFDYATLVTGNEAVSEDIVQEVFIDLWQGRINLKNVDKPSGYIFSIVYHKIYNYLRRSTNERKLLYAFRQKVKDDKDNNAEEFINLREVQKIIDKAVEMLPPQRKLIYKLSREKGLNSKEIARKLDGSISHSTVKKHLVLALNDLRSRLDSSGIC